MLRLGSEMGETVQAFICLPPQVSGLSKLWLRGKAKGSRCSGLHLLQSLRKLLCLMQMKVEGMLAASASSALCSAGPAQMEVAFLEPEFCG